MTIKRVIPRGQASSDIEAVIDHYVREAGPSVALGFIDGIEATYRLIAEHPRIGSPRYAHELDLPGLRHRPIPRYPWLIFYIERHDHIDVWRVLNSRRDIAAWLSDSDKPDR